MTSDLRTAVRALAFAAAALAASGPARAQDVSIDYDPAVDFAGYKTFALKLGTAWGNPLGEKRVVDEITAGLVEKGWTVAAEDTADAIVVLHGATSSKKSLNTFYSGGYGGYGWGGWGGMGTTTTSVSEYTVGTLVTDIFDARTKKLIWRGTAQDELSEKPEKNKKKLAKASDKLFKKFPPGSAEKK